MGNPDELPAAGWPFVCQQQSCSGAGHAPNDKLIEARGQLGLLS